MSQHHIMFIFVSVKGFRTEIYVFNFLACRPYLMVTARSIYRNTESHVAFRKTTAALDTRLISSSAPCHEAKKVSRIAMRVFSYIKDLHNELPLCLLPPMVCSNDAIC